MTQQQRRVDREHRNDDAAAHARTARIASQRGDRSARRELRRVPPAVFLEPRYADGQPYETTRGLPHHGGSGDGGEDGLDAEKCLARDAFPPDLSG